MSILTWLLTIFSCFTYTGGHDCTCTWYSISGTTYTGEIYNPLEYSAAVHDRSKIGKAAIVYTETSAVIVRINDRCPSNVIDLSPKAFSNLANLTDGRIKAKIVYLESGNDNNHH